MKKLGIILVALVCFALIRTTAQVAMEDDVVINEFVVNPTTGKEYVELLVTRPGGVNMQGWTLSDVGTRTGSTTTTEGDVTLPATASYLSCVPTGTYVVIVFTTPAGNVNTLTEDTSLEDGNNKLVLIVGGTAGLTTTGTIDTATADNLQLYAGTRAAGTLIDQILVGSNTSLISGATWGDNNPSTTTDNINGSSAMPGNSLARFVPTANTLAGFQDNDTGARFVVDTNSYGTPGAINTGVTSDSALTNPSFSTGTVPAGCYNGLSIAGAVSLVGDTTVYGALTLNADLTTGSFNLIQPGSGTSTGTGDVIGNVRRSGFTAGGPALSFGNPFNSIAFASGGTLPTSITVNLVKSAPMGFSTAVTRTYTITPTGGSGFSATVRLHYLDGELNGNSEATLKLFRFDSPNWTEITPTAADTTDNWVEASGITTFSPWTLASQGPPMPVCTLTPTTATNQAGSMHTVTATVTNGGSPLPGVTVNFSVTAGPNAGTTGSATTDTNGQATFTYTSNGSVGTDTITASGTVMSVPFTCTATKTWVAPACSLSPPSATNPVGTTHTVTVTVTNGGSPASGIAVNFNVTSGPNAGQSGMGTTDSNGQATFTYTGSGGAGTDTITASGSISGVPFSCTATKDWLAVGCSLSPASATNQVGTSHAVTVTVTQNGAPQPGVAVSFTVSGANTASGTGTTDTNGQATFSYTGSNTGLDTITASGSVMSIPFSCTASK
ncbi:MAG: Ig-like domain-containing protein [Blastocatellia bacterium]|nr:Ig-like domain-containing protein [Blastocatellia bacterium]